MAAKQNNTLSNLTLTQKPQTNGGAQDFTEHARNKVVAAINNELTRVHKWMEGETHIQQRERIVKDPQTGERSKEMFTVRARPWMYKAGDGDWYVDVRYGNKPMFLDGEHNTIKAGPDLKDVEAVLTTLLKAVENKELDQRILETRNRKRNK